MDPDAVLADMREQARQHEDRADDAGRLARLVLTMDMWLASGGFLPLAWSVRRGPAPHELAERS
jgi:hypothetical protein